MDVLASARKNANVYRSGRGGAGRRWRTTCGREAGRRWGDWIWPLFWTAHLRRSMTTALCATDCYAFASSSRHKCTPDATVLTYQHRLSVTARDTQSSDQCAGRRMVFALWREKLLQITKRDFSDRLFMRELLYSRYWVALREKEQFLAELGRAKNLLREESRSRIV